MKIIAYIVELAFAVAMTFLFCTYAGYLLGHMTVGIFVGFALSIFYLGWAIFKNVKENS